MLPINYIVAVYVGKRRNEGVNKITNDPTSLVKMHIERLGNLNIGLVSKATFVVSPSGDKRRDEIALGFVKDHKYSIPGLDIDGFIGPNNDSHSYGSWNFGMKSCLEDDMNFFLIEDDYLPAKDEFYIPFVESMDRYTAYVSQLYVKKNVQMEHAAISNGLMNIEAVRAHVDKFGECISVSAASSKSHNPGVYSQLHFLENFKYLGFVMQNISKNYCHPFLETKNVITIYGNTSGPTLIEPLFYVDKIRSTYKKGKYVS